MKGFRLIVERLFGKKSPAEHKEEAAVLPEEVASGIEEIRGEHGANIATGTSFMDHVFKVTAKLETLSLLLGVLEDIKSDPTRKEKLLKGHIDNIMHQIETFAIDQMALESCVRGYDTVRELRENHPDITCHYPPQFLHLGGNVHANQFGRENRTSQAGHCAPAGR